MCSLLPVQTNRIITVYIWFCAARELWINTEVGSLTIGQIIQLVMKVLLLLLAIQFQWRYMHSDVIIILQYSVIIGPFSFFPFFPLSLKIACLPVLNITLNVIENIKPKKCNAGGEKAKHLTTLGNICHLRGSLSKAKACISPPTLYRGKSPC